MKRPPRASDAAIRRLVIEFNRLARDGDPRTFGPQGEPLSGTDVPMPIVPAVPDERQFRLSWARAHLGIANLVSFCDLSATQAGYLLDLLAGKRTKLDTKLSDLFARADIAHPAEWFSVMTRTAPVDGAASRQPRSKVWWYFRGHDLSQLNRAQKLRLAAILTSRVVGRAPLPSAVPSNAPMTQSSIAQSEAR